MSLLPHTSYRIALSRPSFIFCFLCLFYQGVLQSQNVGINTETPEAGLHVISDNGLILTGEYGQGLLYGGGYGTKMLWNSKTGSFRVGRITDADEGIYESAWHFIHTGDYSFATGINSRASGYAAAAFGDRTQANGEMTFVAGGYKNIAAGNLSFSSGVDNQALSYAEFVIGTNATLYTPVSAEFYSLTDRLFVIGNGENNGERHNAMTVLKSGRVGIGTESPLSLLHIEGTVESDPLYVSGNMLLHAGRLKITGTGRSVFIGQDAGLADNLTDNNAVFIGYEAGKSNVNGSNNIAIGSYAMDGATNSNYNIAMGESALGHASMSGNFNLSIGNFSLENNTSGHDNIALGQNVLGQNQSGKYNVAIGNYAGDSNSSGWYNTAMGVESLGSCISADANTAIGYQSLHYTTGGFNTAIGSLAGYGATGSNNVFLGYEAGANEAGNHKLYISNSNTVSPLIYGDFSQKKLKINDTLQTKYFSVTFGAGAGKVLQSNASGRGFWVEPNTLFEDSEKRNTFLGFASGSELTTGQGNIMMGYAAGADITSANENSGYGHWALTKLTSATYNTAIGISTLAYNETGIRNTALGWQALFTALGNSNVGLGASAGSNNFAGSQNVFVGTNSGRTNNGSGNVFIGYTAGENEAGNDKLVIDNSSTSTPLIQGDFAENKVIINDSLQTKFLSITEGATEGMVLQSNATGRGMWVAPFSLFEDSENLNLFLGQGVGLVTTTATDNTIIGSFAGEDLTSGYENTAFGKWALANTTNAAFNTAIGHNTLNVNVSGINNTAVGWSALSGATGSSNVALGAAAGSENNSGSQNIFLGTEAGMNNTGSGNIFIGYHAGKNLAGSNKLNIDNSDTSTPLIQGDFSSNEVTINDSLTVGKELGVGTSTPASTFEVNGSVAAKFKTPLVAGTTQPDDSGMVWRYNSGTGNITLPGAATCANRMYVIINQTGSTRTISTYRDLATNNQTTIASSVALWLMSDGAQWWQIK